MTDELSLGTRIRRARGRMRVIRGRPMSQKELGQLVGASRSAVNAWENDRTEPGEDVIAALEEVLGTSLVSRPEAADSGEIELRALLASLRERSLTKLDDRGVDRVLDAYRGGGEPSAGTGAAERTG